MRLLCLLLSATTLTACTAGPDYERPSIALSSAFVSPVPAGETDPSWWRQFNDPVLDAIVGQVLAGSPDVEVATARVSQARAAAGAAGAARLPRLDGAGSAEAVSQSLQTPFGAAADQLGFPRGYELYQLGVQASWEIDLFGGLASGKKETLAQLQASAADAASVRLTIIAETVDAYLQLRGLQTRLWVAERQLETRRSLFALVEQRVKEGVAPDRDLNRARGEAQGVEASLSPLRAGVAGQLHRLCILMGRQAGENCGGAANPAPIPAPLLPSGSSAPIDLLRRRPDIVAAERRVAASNARIGAAMSEYYPKISLGGLLGLSSVGTGRLLSGNALQASGGAGLRWRLFDFGRIDAEVAAARGGEAEALALYRRTVLRATEDVENALVRLSEGHVEVTVLEAQAASLKAARVQAQAAYEAGAVALIDVLDADRALLDASDMLAQARAQEARSSVAAIRALGGGYDRET